MGKLDSLKPEVQDYLAERKVIKSDLTSSGKRKLRTIWPEEKELLRISIRDLIIS